MVKQCNVCVYNELNLKLYILDNVNFEDESINYQECYDGYFYSLTENNIVFDFDNQSSDLDVMAYDETYCYSIFTNINESTSCNVVKNSITGTNENNVLKPTKNNLCYANTPYSFFWSGGMIGDEGMSVYGAAASGGGGVVIVVALVVIIINLIFSAKNATSGSDELKDKISGELKDTIAKSGKRLNWYLGLLKFVFAISIATFKNGDFRRNVFLGTTAHIENGALMYYEIAKANGGICFKVAAEIWEHLVGKVGTAILWILNWVYLELCIIEHCQFWLCSDPENTKKHNQKIGKGTPPEVIVDFKTNYTFYYRELCLLKTHGAVFNDLKNLFNLEIIWKVVMPGDTTTA